MIYKKCRRFYNGFNEFIINTVYDQIYLKIVMIYTVQRVYISYYEYDKKYIWLCSANDAILYLNEFRFPKLQVHVYTLWLIFQKFSRHFELHPLCSAGPRQKHDALIILFFMCPCLFYVDSLFSSISRYSLMLRSMLYYVSRYFEQSNCIDIKWISKKLFTHVFVVLIFNIKWFSN